MQDKEITRHGEQEIQTLSEADSENAKHKYSLSLLYWGIFRSFSKSLVYMSVFTLHSKLFKIKSFIISYFPVPTTMPGIVNEWMRHIFFFKVKQF